jgi:hypothetical protein
MLKKLQDEGESHDVIENKGSALKSVGESHDLYEINRVMRW